MENQRRRIEAAEFPLPEVLIQHIQYFLDAEEAAQTCILSKSWYAACSTRPNLDFDYRHFRHLWVFVKKTLQRYEALNLKIESFRLCVDYLKHLNYNLAKELIVKAINMDAVELKFEISYCSETFTLPVEVLGSETLVRLCVSGCTIDVGRDGKVCCRKLKSLRLYNIWVEGDIIGNLISNCPLIEKLQLFSLLHKRSEQESDVNNLFFTNLPCLKKLLLSNCTGYNYKGIEIQDLSLIKCISFKSETWESDIYVTCDSPSAAWFLNLNKLLTCLSFSKIKYLTISIRSNVEKSLDFQALTKAAVETLAIHAPCSSWFMALNSVFRCCRPNFVTLLHVTVRNQRENADDFVENIRNRNVQRVREICLMMNDELENVTIVELFRGKFVVRPLIPKVIRFQLRWREEPIRL